MVGEPEVGKSEFNKYCSTRFEESVEQLHEQVYGVSFAVKILKTIDIEITLVVWNFTGQERYKTIQPHYMQGVSGILLIFDLTRRETFNKLPEWIKFIRQAGQEFPVLLIGSKADLFHLKAVNDADIEEFIRQNEIQSYYEVSFKTGLNVESVIQRMSELIYQARIKKEKLPIQAEIKRPFSDRPLILDEQKVVSEYILTLETIYDMVFDDISNRIVNLERFLDTIGKKTDELRRDWVLEEIDRLSNDLSSKNKQINVLLGTPPIPLSKNLKQTLSENWKTKRDILLYRMLVFKDVFNFLGKLH